MNSPNHILIGTVVYEYLREKYGVTLQKSGFLKGNTCPDHSVSFLRPHKLKYCGRLVRRKTTRLFGAEFPMDRKTSKKIGILCHYYSDFFCCAHSPQFSGSLREHRSYENCLLRYMSDNYEAFRRMDYLSAAVPPRTAGEVGREMERLLLERPAGEGDYAQELFCAIQACAELVLAICTASFSQRPGFSGHSGKTGFLWHFRHGGMKLPV